MEMKKCLKKKKVLNYIHHSLIVISTISGCILISSFVSFVGIPVGIASSTIGLKLCVITAGIKNYKSIIKKKKKHDKIELSAKSKLNSIEVLISKTLTDSSISPDEFVLINNVMKKFYDMKEEIKTFNK